MLEISGDLLAVKIQQYQAICEKKKKLRKKKIKARKRAKKEREKKKKYIIKERA